MARILLALGLLTSLFVAGCAKSGDGAPATTNPAASACTIEVNRLPARVIASSALQFDSTPTCGFSWTSEHVGAHYGSASAAAPTTNGDLGTYSLPCNHHQGASSGTDATSCTIQQAGTYYLRGHARIDLGGVLTDFWSREYLVVAVNPGNEPPPGSPQVLLYNVPSAPRVGETFTMPLEVAWAVPSGTNSNHVGAHYDSAAHPNPGGAYGSGCSHVGGAVPGMFSITCTLGPAGTQYLRGHARFENGGETHDYWSDELAIAVT